MTIVKTTRKMRSVIVSGIAAAMIALLLSVSAPARADLTGPSSPPPPPSSH
jgi:hypothetical protein